MIEQLTFQAELCGAVQDATAVFRYYGSNNIELDEVYLEGRRTKIDDLERREIQTIYSHIRNHKLLATAI